MTNLLLGLSAEISETRLAQLTRDLSRDLSRAGIAANLVEEPATPGEKGDPVTFGVITLGLVTSGTIKALIECFTAYLSRERSLTIKFAAKDGAQIEVNARNVGTPEVRAVLEAVASAKPG